MKKLISIILSAVMIIAMSVSVFAANTEGGSTEITFNVDPTFTVTIPKTVTLVEKEAEGSVTYENDYVITAQAGVRLKKGEIIVVTVESDYEMSTNEGATLEYTITKDNEALVDSVVAVFGTDKNEQTSTIHIAAPDPEYAGDYTDTVVFTITVISENS